MYNDKIVRESRIAFNRSIGSLITANQFDQGYAHPEQRLWNPYPYWCQVIFNMYYMLDRSNSTTLFQYFRYQPIYDCPDENRGMERVAFRNNTEITYEDAKHALLCAPSVCRVLGVLIQGC